MTRALRHTGFKDVQFGDDGDRIVATIGTPIADGYSGKNPRRVNIIAE